MTITFVANHFCIRAMKQAIALKKLGHTVYGVGSKKPQFFEKLDLFVRCPSVKNMREAIKVIDKSTDVYYVHTEPYYMVWIIKELSKKKILLDMHDSMQWRMPTEHEWRSAEERSAIRMADALVVPSDECKRLTPVDKEIIVMPSYCNEDFIAYVSSEWIGGVVYEGRADALKSPPYMDYCKYHDTAAKFKELGLPFYIYAVWNSQDHVKEYKDAHTIPTQEYPNLIKKLSCHDWGLVGNVNKVREWDLALPNKLFEYVTAGIPVVAINAKQSSKFLAKHKIGITVKSLEELKDRWDERAELQENVLKKRHSLTMEKHIKPIEDICQKLAK